MYLIEKRFIKNFFSIYSEQYILSSLILYNNSWNDIYCFLTINDFYFKNHKIIFSVVLELLNLNVKFDLYSIYSRIKFNNFNFDFLNYLNYIIQKTPNPFNIVFHSRIIHNMYILRKILSLFNDAFLNIFKFKIFDLNSWLIFIENSLFNIVKSYLKEKNNFFTINNILYNYINYDFFFLKDKIFTGFKLLDKFLHGINRGDFLIIAGRPSMGKTTFCLNISEYISSSYDLPVLIFSMEMSAKQVFIRILSSLLNKDQNEILNILQNFSINKMDKDIMNKINSSKLFIDETSNLDITQIYTKCKFLIKEHGELGLIVIDYIQLMVSSSPYNQNRNFEISEISRALKCLARELNVPIIAISQLNRNLELRNDKRPIMSDIRESGSIEQDADIIIFIYRDEFYNSLNSSNKNISEIIIAKHRNGPIGSFNLYFFENFSKFVDY